MLILDIKADDYPYTDETVKSTEVLEVEDGVSELLVTTDFTKGEGPLSYYFHRHSVFIAQERRLR